MVHPSVEYPSTSRPPFEILIRPIEPEDVDCVKAIEMAWPLLSHWDIEVYRRVAEALETARGMVATERGDSGEGRILGFLVYRAAGSEVEILNFAVDPSAARRRIGTRLLHYLQSTVMQAGVTTLFLEVRPSNSSARELYLKEKFTEVGRRKDYYSNPIEDAILMKRHLD